MDLGDRLIKLANKLLSAGSSETLGTQGGITNATANDVLVPTSKAVKDYVDGRTQPATTSSAGVVQLSDDINSSNSTVAATSAAIKQLHDLSGIEFIATTNTSDEHLTATSTTLSEVKEGTMILLKVVNPFNIMHADSRLTLTLKNGEVLNKKLIRYPDSLTYLPSDVVPPNTIFLMRYTGVVWNIIDQHNLATQSFRGLMSAEDKTKLDDTYTKAEIDELKYDLDDLMSYQSGPVEFYDFETVVYDQNNPWEYQQLGRVVHIAGNFICKTSLSSTNPVKVAHRLPHPFKEVVTVQQGVGKNTYTLKIDEAGDMYIYNYGINNISNFPANVALPVHVTYLMEW